MAEQPPIDRAATARAHDDHDLIERAADEAGGGEASRSGGRTATDVGTRDELKEMIEPDAGLTRATGQDKVQPIIPSRADNEGAQG